MKNFRPPYHVDFHSERGEVTIYVTDADGKDVWYADTDAVNQLVEDGFISTRGFVMGRNMRPDVLERSVLDYLREVGVISDGGFPRRDNPMVGRAFGAEIWVYPSADVRRGETPKKWYAELMSDGKVWMSAEGRTQEEATQAIKAKIADAKRGERESDREQTAAMYMRHRNPTQTDVENWTERYRASVQKRVDGVPSQAQYVVKIVTTKGEAAFLRVGKGTKFDTDANSARVYRSGEKANEAATKVSNWLKKKNPAKWKAIKSISAEPKK